VSSGELNINAEVARKRFAALRAEFANGRQLTDCEMLVKPDRILVKFSRRERLLVTFGSSGSPLQAYFVAWEVGVRGASFELSHWELEALDQWVGFLDLYKSCRGLGRKVRVEVS
jgi:hypothetical protein